MPEFDVTDDSAVPGTAEDAEALISHWEQPAREDEPEPETAAPEPETPSGHTLKYKGKDETYPLEKIIQFAQQGRDYSEKMRELKLMREEIDQTRQKYPEDLVTRISRYGEIENYIKQNPAWWDHLNQQWQARESFQGQGNTGAPLTHDPVIQNLLQTVEGLQQKATVAEQREQALKLSQEDESLDSEISGYREKYSHFDWKTVDENGFDLERRILDHAVKMGLTKPEQFRVAANDYLHDEHLKRAQLSAKETVGKQIQKTNKLGLGPVTDRRTMPIKGVQNVSNKSWDDVAAAAIEAMG